MDFITILKQKLRAKEIRVLLENFFSLSALQIFGYVLPLITLPYLVRVLGVEKYGLVAFANSFVAYFQMLTDYGLYLSAIREVSVHREDKQQLNKIFSTVMIIKSILLAVSFLILLVIVFGFSKFSANWELYLFAFGLVIGSVLFPVWFFQGMEKMKYSTIFNILSQVIFTLAIFVFIRVESDFIYVPLINSLGFIVAGVLSLVLVYRNFGIRLVRPELSFLWETFKDSTQFFLSRASVSIYTSSNAFFLGLFTSPTLVGYYSAAEKLYIAAQGLYGPLIQSIYPFMAHKQNISLYKKIFKIIVLLTIAFSVILILMSGFLVDLLFGADFQASVDVFRIFCIALLVVAPSQLIGYPFLAALGYPKYANLSVIVGSIVHIIMLAILALTLYLNIYSVAILVCITETVVLILRLYGIKVHNLWK